MFFVCFMYYCFLNPRSDTLEQWTTAEYPLHCLCRGVNYLWHKVTAQYYCFTLTTALILKGTEQGNYNYFCYYNLHVLNAFLLKFKF